MPTFVSLGICSRVYYDKDGFKNGEEVGWAVVVDLELSINSVKVCPTSRANPVTALEEELVIKAFVKSLYFMSYFLDMNLPA